jgi:rod shape-determining protein MreC
MINVFGRAIRPPSQLTRLVLAAGISALMMFFDHRGHHLEQIRGALTVLTYPIQVVANVPARAIDAVADLFKSEHTLRDEVESLQDKNTMLLAKLEQFDAIEAENIRLRDMVGAAARVTNKALAAELIAVSTEPFSRNIMISRGTRDGVFISQPVIDAYGIVGQVTHVTENMSRVTLITDPGHAIPVLVNRNGLRALVFGTGAPDTVNVPYLTASADIKEGDVLVSSGMGGTFPAGYPVAKVTKIVNDPDESFLEITAVPMAHLNHSKQVLLIWPGPRETTVRPAAAEKQPPLAHAPAATPAPRAPAPKPKAVPSAPAVTPEPAVKPAPAPTTSTTPASTPAPSIEPARPAQENRP